MSWRDNFAAFDVPTWVDSEPGLIDISGPGGDYPWFTQDVFGIGASEGPTLSMWVDHPDRDGWGERYAVVVDTTEGVDMWPVVDTSDPDVAQAALAWVRSEAQTHGLKFLALYPEGVMLFKPSGGWSHPSVRDISLLERPRVASPSVKRALDAINVHRAKVGMSPLDPGRAGWTDQDVVLEAERIGRLANLGVMP